MPTVSLTMIVRDEQANLPGCLASCDGLFDELIIVDTGSTDRTKAIAAAATDKHGRQARVFDFEWCDDFAAARNESVRRATSDWIFWMDADDRLDLFNRDRLRWLIAQLSSANGFRFFATVNVDGRQLARSPRLTPKTPSLRWVRRIHEQLICDEPLLWVDAQLVIQHIGYDDPDVLKTKKARNLRLMEFAIVDSPRDAAMLYRLGLAYRECGFYDEANRALARSLAIEPDIECQMLAAVGRIA